MIEIGTQAPAFTLKDASGNIHTLKQYAGNKIAIYFYPEDDTPTCTEQACNLRDNYSILKEKKIILLGISADTEIMHKKFSEKYTLPFTLLADTNMKTIHKYGVWGEKNMYGHKFMGLKRTTFLINEKGIVDAIIKKPIAKKHTTQILKAWRLY